MSDNDIQQVRPSTTTLNAERYQTFEMAKANDDILGGTDISKIRASQARTRAEAQAIYKMMSEMDRIEDVATSKSELLETSQLYAKYSVYGDQRIGELLRELPKCKGNQYQQSAEVGTPTKAQVEKQANLDHHTAIDLQKMAANPEVVEAVIAKAEAEGRIVTRSQVLKAIKEKQDAERELDTAMQDLEDAFKANEAMQDEVDSLKQQLAQKPKPEIVEREVVREVVPDDYEDMKRQVSRLKHDTEIYVGTNKKLRRQLDDAQQELGKARDILGMDKTMQDVRRDVQYLTSATINYVRRYGGLTWTVQQLGEIDDESLDNLRNSVKNLATFSVALTEALDREYGKRHS